MYDPALQKAYENIPSRHDTYGKKPAEEGTSEARVKYTSIWDDEDIVFDEADSKESNKQSAMIAEAQEMARSAVEELRKNGKLDEMHKRVDKVMEEQEKNTADAGAGFVRMKIEEEDSDEEALGLGSSLKTAEAGSGKFKPPSRSAKVEQSQNELDELD